ncbi:MAG: very short patch repair endonuclease [Flavobacteriales bacterium]
MSKKKAKNKKEYIRDGRAPLPVNERTARTMSRIRGKNTKPELRFRKALWHAGMKGYRLHYKNAPGKPDIAFPGRKLAIFVHGCYWHRCPYCRPSMPKTHSAFWKEKFRKNVERDQRKKEALEDEDWTVLTIWECQIKKQMEEMVEAVREWYSKLPKS